jgi:hypothetical protein
MRDNENSRYENHETFCLFSYCILGHDTDHVFTADTFLIEEINELEEIVGQSAKVKQNDITDSCLLIADTWTDRVHDVIANTWKSCSDFKSGKVSKQYLISL